MKYRIIIIDLYPQIGHFHFNNEIISAFTKVADVTVLAPESNYLNDENKNNIKHLIDNSTRKIYEKVTKFKYIELLLNYYTIARHLTINDYSLIYVLTFHNVHVILFLISLKKSILKKTYFNLHNNLDSFLTNSRFIESFLFTHYHKKINAVYNSPFIYPYVKAKKFKFKSLNLINHPAIFLNLTSQKKNKYDCVFISLSNNESLLKEIIDFESKSQFLSENDLRIFIRIKNNLKLNSIDIDESNWIDIKNKNFLLASTWSVGVFFSEKNYKLRVSASIIEALSNNKIVFATKTDVSEYYSREFPNIVFLIDSIEDYFSKLYSIKSMIGTNETINQFISFQEKTKNDLIIDCKLLLSQLESDDDFK